MRIETSVKVYRILIHVDKKLSDIAYTMPNCIVSNKSKWRCTLHRQDFTMNIFNANKLSTPALVAILFTKDKPLEEIAVEFETIFGKRPCMQSIKLLNWVSKIYTEYTNLDLDEVFDDLDEYRRDNLDDIFIVKGTEKKTPEKIRRYDEYEPVYDSEHNRNGNSYKPVQNDTAELSIDKQRFSALIITPFPEETNMTIELYSSGVLNCAGIPNEQVMEKTQKYVKDVLIPLFEKNGQDNDIVI
jgi:hypothetical protein